jgi:hypothetical protein
VNARLLREPAGTARAAGKAQRPLRSECRACRAREKQPQRAEWAEAKVLGWLQLRFCDALDPETQEYGCASYRGGQERDSDGSASASASGTYRARAAGLLGERAPHASLMLMLPCLAAALSLFPLVLARTRAARRGAAGRAHRQPHASFSSMLWRWLHQQLLRHRMQSPGSHWSPAVSATSSPAEKAV